MVFSGHSSVVQVTLGEVSELVIVGGAVCAAGPVLAFYAGGTWHVGERLFERITCAGPVRVEIRRGQRLRTLGPFEEFELAGATARVGEDLLARYDPFEETWCFGRQGIEFETMVVRALQRQAS